MRSLVTLVGVTILALILGTAFVAVASVDLPRSFAACVLRGGDVRRHGDDISCRYVATDTMRTYLVGTTDCGEEVHYEIWGDLRYGVVRFLFAPARSVVLPEIRDHRIGGPMELIPCLDNPED